MDILIRYILGPIVLASGTSSKHCKVTYKISRKHFTVPRGGEGKGGKGEVAKGRRGGEEAEERSGGEQRGGRREMSEAKALHTEASLTWSKGHIILDFKRL